MTAPARRVTTTCALAAVPLLLLGGPSVGNAAPAADGDHPPAMSIALTNGVETVAAGTKVAYTVTVRNQGPRHLTGLRVEQELPAGASAGAAGQRASVVGGKAVWTVDVRAHGSAVLTSTARVAARGTGALRAASTACAYLPKSHVPVVCSSDMDLLRTGGGAGAAALAGPQGVRAAPEERLLGMDRPVGLGVLAGVAALAGGGVWALRRRTRLG
ncbi:hypothetical protein ACFYVL_06375 [Streptomyces sp. NPDC004111]|uniref:hypothetical protein n=1 Tax=Streptomyces sp. NPDC004111 TaxID=3364690 RepID=UPI00367AF3E1